MSDQDYQGQHEAEPVVGDAPPTASVFLSNKAYDFLQILAVVILPALGTMYFGLAGIWGLPKAEEVVGTIVVVDAFLGILLRASKKQYENSDARFDGTIVVRPDEENSMTDLAVSLDPRAIETKKEIVVKIEGP